MQPSIPPIQPLEEVAIRLNAPIEPGPADILPGFLPRRGVLVIAGETNVGKSLVALETISALVTETPLWGELQPTIKAKKVLYILGEHHDGVIQRLYQKTRLPITDQVFLLGPERLGWDKWLVVRGQPNVQAIMKFKRWAEGCDLVVWDPLSAFVVGEAVEQDNITMRLALDQMGLVAASAGAACLVLAHQGKPMMDFRGQEHARKSYAIRGASSVEDAATNIFYMGRGEDDPTQRAAEGRVFEMNLRKYKGDAPDRYRLFRDPETLTHSLLGNKPLSEVQRMAIVSKIGRLQAFNQELDYKTCIRLVAAMDGVPELTIRRHLGIKE